MRVWSAVPTIGAMGDVTWVVVVGAAVIFLALGFVVLRRRSNVGRPAAMRAARRAIRQSASDHRRRGRGSIRGRGFGGDDNQGYNAGVTSDGGGVP
jgi:hypothetical protein